MSSQFRYLLTGEQVIATLLRAHPEDEAMERAVGGDFERFGVLEHAVLREAGLRPDSNVIDVGCGAGRLAVQLARHEGMRYLGTDVVPALLEYARKRAARPDFRFINVDRIAIPAEDGSADIIAFFSVLTHLLHEESYLYLQEAHRVLKPGGKVVFSFFEFDTPIGETVFEANLDWVRKRIIASQINVFMNRADIRVWARRLGFRVEALRGGEPGSVTVGLAEATDAIPAGSYAFGQSICVLRKPAPDEAEDREAKRPRAADDPERAARRAQRRQDRAAGATAAAEVETTPKRRERDTAAAAAARPARKRAVAMGSPETQPVGRDRMEGRKGDKERTRRDRSKV
jgi:ubiquinone/menaquinone biosynthesis C-methylase UbiE